nr:GUN4 domain-containing protein [Crocosphaera chwakensis]
MDQHHVKKSPCHNLKMIDQLWHEASNGRFSFSVQNKALSKFRRSIKI